MLIDSHCHLDHEDFAGEVDDVLRRARDAGVRRFLTISTTLEGFPRVREIAERNDDVWCTVGVHPHDAAGAAALTADELVDLARHPKVVGIGECGLDFHYNRSPEAVQISVFRTHIAAARESGLPLVIHSRDADGPMAAILREEAGPGVAGGTVRGVVHCFSSGPELAAAAVEVGFAVSFSGILTFRKSEALRDIARGLPRDRLLVETDAPYLAPVPLRGRRNEPAFVGRTLAALAACRGETVAETTAATGDNFFRLFRKIPPV